MKYCSSCGHPNQDDANFCIKCGHPFEALDEWYYANEGRKIGPHTANEMKVLFDKNIIFNTTYVWKKGLSDWIRYEQTDLFSREKAVQKSNRFHEGYEEVPETFLVDENDDDIPLEVSPKQEEGWHYADGIHEVGPFSKAEMIRMFSQKTINLETLVRHSHQKEWMTLSASKLLPKLKEEKARSEEDTTWYYAVNEESYGPHSKEEMVHYYQIGKITQNMYVWNKGMRDWVLFKDSELMPRISLNKSRSDTQEWKQNAFIVFLKEKVVPKIKELVKNAIKKDPEKSAVNEPESIAAEDSGFESRNVLTILIFLFVVCLVAILSFFVFQ